MVPHMYKPYEFCKIFQSFEKSSPPVIGLWTVLLLGTYPGYYSLAIEQIWGM